MLTVMWTFRMAQARSRNELVDAIEQSGPRYLNVPGLVRKYFGIAADGSSIVGIYLWDSRDAADAFYTPAWIDAVTQKWGAPPLRVDWDTPLVVESRTGELRRG